MSKTLLKLFFKYDNRVSVKVDYLYYCSLEGQNHPKSTNYDKNSESEHKLDAKWIININKKLYLLYGIISTVSSRYVWQPCKGIVAIYSKLVNSQKKIIIIMKNRILRHMQFKFLNFAQLNLEKLKENFSVYLNYTAFL